MITSGLIWFVLITYFASIAFTVMGFVVNMKVTESTNSKLVKFTVFAVLLILGLFVYELFTFSPSHQQIFELFLIISSIVSICLSVGVYVYSNMVKTLHEHEKYRDHYNRCQEINLEKEIKEFKEEKVENVKALNEVIFRMRKVDTCAKMLKRKYTTHARG